jgi:hypothetical protein
VFKSTRRPLAAWVSALLFAAVFVAIAPQTAAPPAQAATNPCAAPVVSAVACENTLTGDPQTDWVISGAGDSTIQGYATQMSVNVGETVTFKVNTPAKAYHFDILRLGYYQGNGARKIAANLLPTATLPQTQPACQTFSDTGLIDCGNWAPSASWTVPANAVSGVYIAHLVRNDTGGDSWITFVVRNDSSTSSILFQTSDETWQAYNTYGGNSLYQCTVACPPGNPLAYKAAFKVSYNRPFHTALDDQGRSWLTQTELPMIRFLEANGYDMSYQAGNDTATRGSLLLNHKTFLTSGHDEYVSYDQRTNIETARDKGVNVAMFTGNELFWRTRWEPSQAGTATAGRTLVCYKDTHFNAPTDPVTWTGTYADPRFGTANGAGNPQNSLTGQFFNVNSGSTDITVPARFAGLRMWRNTQVASLSGSQSLTLGANLNTLGYEWDINADNGFRPAGLFPLSSTTNTSSEVFTDYGSTTTTGKTATHSLTEYRAPSGALVFGAGTVQWSWGLDNFTTGAKTDANMQQATVNLLADMGAQPVTLIAGLKPATASTDTTAPTSTITAPAANASVADGTAMTISGTASDTGGGVVAGVEVSTDGGTTWHPATGTTSWTYSWVAHGNPTTAIKSRAVDDSGNLEKPGAGVVLSVNCPCSLFGTGTKPANPDSGDPSSVEVGAQFYSDVAGTITGVRFYKAGTNTGTHVGNLWTTSGTLLATATFSGESTSGWQSVSFSKPVAITAGTRYIVSYYAPKGHYSEDAGYFYNNPSPQPAGGGSVDFPPLHFTRSLPGAPNGFYVYNNGSAFPSNVYNAEYYWVDAIFQPSGPTPPAVTSTSPTSGATGVAVNAAPSATFNQAVTASSVSFTLKDASGATVNGTTALNGAATTATFTPSSSLAYSTQYTATVTGATNSTGQTMAPYSWSFTTVAAPPAPTVSSTSPASGATGVAASVTPSATFSQTVTASSVTFTLKDASGTSISGSTSLNGAGTTATFTPSSALAYSTQYTATVSGATNATGQTMASPYTWSFTTAAAPPAPAVNSTSPASNATGVAISVTPSATFNQAVTGSSVTFTLKDPGGNAVNGSATLNSAATTVTFTPSSALAYSTQYTATVSGATNSTGQTMTSPYTWSFTTAAAPPAPNVSSSNPAPGATGVAVTATVNATFSQDVSPSSIQFAVTDPTGASIGGSVSYSSATTTATFTPTAALAYGTQYTATVSGATNSTGQTMSPYSWSFTTAAPPAAPNVSSTIPSPGATGVAVSSAVSATFNQAVTASSVQFVLKDASGATVAGSVSYSSSTTTATFSPSSALANSTQYTATVSGATNSTGQTMSPYSWSFTTAPAYTCPCSVFASSSTPATASANDTNGVELGMKFQTDTAGHITGVRFYKGSLNTGTHIGNLWSASGTKLASVTFSGESASGWQQASFSTPVAVTANTTYVISYFAPNGGYAYTANGFSSNQGSSPIFGLSSGSSGGNGVFSYGSSSTFPTGSFNATNYWVDAVFNAGSTTAPKVLSVSPSQGSTSVAATTTVSATFDQAIDTSSATFSLAPSGGAAVAGNTTTASTNGTYTFTPSSALAANTTYTATVSGVKNSTGQAMTSAYSWSFTTGSASFTCPCSIFGASSTPATANVNDTNAVELGAQFTADVSGSVTAIRFYKGAQNTGTHVGHLWTASGTLLATVTFTGETSSGWQTATLSSPVAISANTTYVVSYYAPNGFYSANGGYFNTAADAPPLHGLASTASHLNGLYRYGASAFPTDSYNATNYWVDVVFTTP